MAKYVEYKMAKSFKEAINDKKGTLFEIFHMSKEGYSVKRYLCRVRYGDRHTRGDGLNKETIVISLISKNGSQSCGSWRIATKDYYGAKINDVASDTVTHYGAEIITLSRDVAYKHCMDNVKRKIAAIKRNAIKLHEAIYTL